MSEHEDRAKLIEALRPAVAEEWAKIVAAVEARGGAVKPWPEDERRCALLSDAEGQPCRALTFGCRVPYREPQAALVQAVRAALAGSEHALLAERDLRAPGRPLLVRAEPQPFLHADMAVGVRCRVGFEAAAPAEVLPQRADALPRAQLLTDQQLAQEELRARWERGEGQA